jgi:hypothetical protein
MRLKCIGCDSLARLLYRCAADSPHLVDLTLLKLGLHSNSNELRAHLQEEIDRCSGQEYGMIALAYGLCGRAAVGITARAIPIVIPRAHDCITLFLGSRARYNEQVNTQPGTYWYTKDYIERGSQDGKLTALGAGLDGGLSIEDEYDQYVAKYGKDNADYLMEVMGAWRSHYQRAAFIDMGVGSIETVEQKAQEDASKRGWQYERLTGDMGLIRRLLNGDWQEDFLILQPGQTLEMSYDEQIMLAVRPSQDEN